MKESVKKFLHGFRQMFLVTIVLMLICGLLFPCLLTGLSSLFFPHQADGSLIKMCIRDRLLCVLAKNTGKVLTHNYILKEVWGSALAADIPSLRVFMATLRKKIEKDPSDPQYIQTHIGVGYRMIRQ